MSSFFHVATLTIINSSVLRAQLRIIVVFNQFIHVRHSCDFILLYVSVIQCTMHCCLRICCTVKFHIVNHICVPKLSTFLLPGKFLLLPFVLFIFRTFSYFPLLLPSIFVCVCVYFPVFIHFSVYTHHKSCQLPSYSLLSAVVCSRPQEAPRDNQ